MSGETNLTKLIKNMRPELNPGEYVFATVKQDSDIPQDKIICFFREKEGITLVLERSTADKYNISYNFTAAWITLKVHSALEAVGLTAAFSNALTNHNISANVIAGYYHDHIFVDIKDAKKAITVLYELSASCH